MTDDAVVLNETIHQSTRLRIMTLLVLQHETDRLVYGFIQKTLDLTGGNLTNHLRRLKDAGYLNYHQRVPGFQAVHMGTGHAGGAPGVRRIPFRLRKDAEMAAACIACR